MKIVDGAVKPRDDADHFIDTAIDGFVTAQQRLYRMDIERLAGNGCFQRSQQSFDPGVPIVEADPETMFA